MNLKIWVLVTNNGEEYAEDFTEYVAGVFLTLLEAIEFGLVHSYGDYFKVVLMDGTVCEEEFIFNGEIGGRCYSNDSAVLNYLHDNRYYRE